MLLFQLVLTVMLLTVCSFAPGFFFVRRFPWNPVEKLCGSVGLSLLLLFLVWWVVFIATTGAAGERIPAWLVSACCVYLAIAVRRDAARLFRARRARQVAAGYGFLLLWTLLILGMIRVYSGGRWFGDWIEHFQRSLFFLHHLPLHIVILSQYEVPARPPMMNALAAFFLANTADRFEIFQVVFTFLNLLAFLPCCLIMPRLAGGRRQRVLPLLCLFALNPALMQNAAYSWTKLFAAFYVVLAICLYLAGWRKADRRRITSAFVALSAGMVAHYSVGPYLVLLTGHYLLMTLRRRSRRNADSAAPSDRKRRRQLERAKARERARAASTGRMPRWREIMTVAVISAIPLLVWLGWSIAAFGMHSTFASNTTVTASQRYEGSTAGKMAANLFDSLVPAFLRNPPAAETLKQRSNAGTIRDFAFVFYQQNLIFSLGIAGGPVTLWLLYSAFRKRQDCGPEGRFWLAFIPCCVVVGIAATGERESLGCAHLTLISLEAIGLAFLAAALPVRRSLAAVLVAGCMIDFSLGVLLQARVENLENTTARTFYPGVVVANGRVSVAERGPDSLSESAEENWYSKHQYQLS